LSKKSDRREKVKLSFGENRKSIALTVLEIFEFKEAVFYVLRVCGLEAERGGGIPKYGSHQINLMF
jgi:hypothetical protein